MIHKVEKRRYRKNGGLKTTRNYYLRHRFGNMLVDRWKSLGVTDKQVAERKAQEFRQEKEREAAGIIEPKVIRDAATRRLAAHLEDYVADLEKRNRAGRNGRGGRQLKMRGGTLLDECKWSVSSHVSADSFNRMENRTEKISADAQPLFAGDDFVFELAGTRGENQMQSVEIRFEN